MALDAHRALVTAADHALEDTHDGRHVGVLCLKLSRLRALTIALGLERIERLSEALDARLSALLRPTDRYWRPALDEVLILLPDLISLGHGELAVRKILHAFQQPFVIDRHPLTLAVTIGQAYAPTHADDGEALLRRAAAGVELALRNGWDTALAPLGLDQPLLVDHLRQALSDNALEVVFQPIQELVSGRCVAVEALARWHDATLGPISPQRFVPLAEHAGLAAELTRWSLYAALREFAPLRRADPELTLSLNLSARSLADHGVSELIGAALAIWNLPPRRLRLEVTETAVIEDPVGAAEALGTQRALGVQVAIDDFGRGYSSFAYLRHFPITELKIDQAYAQGLSTDPKARRLLRSLVDLAHNLDLKIVVEGIEQPDDLECVRALGADYGQGYAIGRPEPAAHWLERLA